MKNLTQEEKDYILKVLNYDLRMATEGLNESLFCSTDVNNSARNFNKKQVVYMGGRILIR